jgi:hypothetical protein
MEPTVYPRKELLNKALRILVVLVTIGLAASGCLKSIDRGLDEQSIEGEITPGVPAGWSLFGPVDGKPAFDFYCGYDTVVKHGGARSATFLAIGVTNEDQARLTQRFLADRYRGRRVRFTGYLKTNKVNFWAGLWMRVDTATRVGWAFDDMEDRGLSGTTDWTRCSVVLDVPEDGAAIYIGAVLHGRGQVWVDDCTFEVVGDDVPATDGSRLRGGRERTFSIPQLLPDEPVNLDFEETETL